MPSQSSSPSFPNGPYQPYSPAPGNYHSGVPTPGPQYPGGPNQAYNNPAPGPGPNQYPNQQNYNQQSGPNQYPGNPHQQQNPSPPFANGNYHGSVPAQPQFSNAQSVAPLPPTQPPFYPAQANNIRFQQQNQPQRPQKRGPGWKALFFVVPVILVVLASIFGPTIIRNVNAGKHPLSNITRAINPAAQESELSQQQLQGLQQYDEQMHYKQLARLYTSQMTLDEKIGQLMVVTYTANQYSQDLDYMLNQQHVGGVILYKDNLSPQIQTPDQAKQDIAKMQQRATFPLFVSIDEEGWNVDRLSQVYPVPPNPKRLAADDIHRTNDPAVATSEGQRVAHDMMVLGINVNFAPDVDVATNHGYIDWDYRAFGENPDDVLKYSAPYLEAMQGGGVIGTLKHFVGLGAVPRGNANDPHFVLPVTDLTKDQIENHMLPFKHFIQSPNKLDHPGFIMPTDLMVPSIDPKYPTEFSHIFITDMLRNELGYDGVVITDSLQMGGVQLNGITLTEANASVLALQAGCDMLLDIAGSDQVAAVNTAIKAALQDGTLTQARIDEAVTRIITLKMERNVVPSIQGANLNA
jgi:beta-N-acetylhexosaminidase